MSSRSIGFSFALALGCINAIGPTSALIYAPSMPEMARELGSPVGMIQATLSVYLLSYGAFQLIWGPLSDRFGRRTILLAGCALFAVASIVCAVVARVDWLLAARIMQGIGACAGAVVGRAIIRDVYQRSDTARLIAMLSAFNSIVTTCAPVIGGILHASFGWRASFIVIAVLTSAIFGWMCLAARETIVERQVVGGLFRGSLRGFAELMRIPQFVVLGLVVTGSSACIYAFIIAAPVILIDRFGVPPDLTGYYIAIQPAGFIAGSLISSRLATRVALERLVVVGLIGGLATGVLMVAVAGDVRPWVLAAPFTFFGFFHAFITNNSHAIGVSLRPQYAGAASGYMGFMQTAGGGVSIMVFAAIQIGSFLPIAVLMIVYGVTGLFGVLRVTRGGGSSKT